MDVITGTDECVLQYLNPVCLQFNPTNVKAKLWNGVVWSGLLYYRNQLEDLSLAAATLQVLSSSAPLIFSSYWLKKNLRVSSKPQVFAPVAWHYQESYFPQL